MFGSVLVSLRGGSSFSFSLFSHVALFSHALFPTLFFTLFIEALYLVRSDLNNSRVRRHRAACDLSSSSPRAPSTPSSSPSYVPSSTLSLSCASRVIFFSKRSPGLLSWCLLFLRSLSRRPLPVPPPRGGAVARGRLVLPHLGGLVLACRAGAWARPSRSMRPLLCPLRWWLSLPDQGGLFPPLSLVLDEASLGCCDGGVNGPLGMLSELSFVRPAGPISYVSHWCAESATIARGPSVPGVELDV